MRGTCWGRSGCLMLAGIAFALATSPGVGQADSRQKQKIDAKKYVKTLREGTSSKTSRQSAEALLRTAKMTTANRRRVNAVIKKTSYFREMPTLRFATDPRAYLYLTSRPDVTVAIWRAMGISKFHLQQTATNNFTANTGDGTKGKFEVMHQSAGHHVILCDGVLKTPLLFGGVTTRSVIHMQTQFTRDKTTGQTYATHRAFVHVSFPSAAVGTVAKLLSPVGNTILDRNFREISLFVHVMSKAMSRQPGWVENLTKKMKQTSQQQKRDLLRVTARVYYAARKQETVPLFKSKQEYYRELVRPLQTASGASTSDRN